MSNGTAPAWQARDIAREKVFEQIKQAIESMEDEFENRLDLYRLVLHLVDTELSNEGFCMSMMSTLPSIPWETRQATFGVLMSVDATIKQFQRAPEEGIALWAKISKWAVAKIADSHIAALEALEMSNPLLIYRVTDRTKEVPVE